METKQWTYSGYVFSWKLALRVGYQHARFSNISIPHHNNLPSCERHQGLVRKELQTHDYEEAITKAAGSNATHAPNEVGRARGHVTYL